VDEFLAEFTDIALVLLSSAFPTIRFASGTPSPRGYLGDKILVINSLQAGCVCKILITNGLPIKYLLSIN
jgi:hypothetical protein